MDIYTATNKANWLLTYTNELAENTPGMYKSSKERLRNIAQMCTEVVQNISLILQEEMLSQDDEDISHKDAEILQRDVRDMGEKLLEVAEFMNTSYNVAQEASYDVSDSDAVEAETKKYAEKSEDTAKISRQERKSILVKYEDILSISGVSDDSYVECQECKTLVHTWFSARFLKNSNTPGFRYDIRRIPEWIEDIVIAYCYHKREGTLDSFNSDFYRWCKSLDEKTCVYAVPYEIYLIDTDTSSYMTLQAVVLWDVLVDHGYIRLNELKDKSLNHFSNIRDHMYERCRDSACEELNYYTDYTYDPDILSKLNFIKCGDNT